jgi:transposase
MTAMTLEAHWTYGDINRVTRPDATGKPLPAFAYKALERLGWTVRAPEGVWVCSRLRRIAAENAGRVVRAAAHRQALIRVLASAWPEKVSWNDLPEGTSPVLLRNVRRQLRTYAAEHSVPADAGPDGIPATLPEVQPEPPMVPGQLFLAVTDRQFATIRLTGDGLLEVRVKLPTSPSPASPDDWQWHTLGITGFRRLTDRPGWQVRPPTLWLPTRGHLRIAIPVETPCPSPRPAQEHTIALGVDWGLSHLLTATVVARLPDSSIASPGRPLFFSASGMLVHYRRTRGNLEQLRARTERLRALIVGYGEGQAPTNLSRRYELLKEEAACCAGKLISCNTELARLAARWLLDQAAAQQATVLAVEDLTTLEARGLGRNLNGMLSPLVRGAILMQLRTQAALAGIVIVEVDARGTSAQCPRCTAWLRHVRAPDDRRAGYAWAHCSGCGLSLDRDHAAAERIGMRGLLALTGHQTMRRGQRLLARRVDDRSVQDCKVRRRRTCRRPPLPQIPRRRIPHQRRHQKGPGSSTRPCARSAGLPPQPLAEHRSAGHTSRISLQRVPLAQRNEHSGNVSWCPFDGTRYAYRHRTGLTATPVRDRDASRFGFSA